MQQTPPPAPGPIDAQLVRNIIQHANQRTTTADHLNQPIELLEQHLSGETQLDESTLTAIKRALKILKSERRRRWNSAELRRQTIDLERRFGTALDRMAAEEQEELLTDVCRKKGWDPAFARRGPQTIRRALLRELADRQNVP